jgi:fructose-1,6-bisphosphatase/inositol monophosphatase family enzyme
MRIALYECGRVAKKFKGKVVREDKEPEQYQISTSVSDVDRVCQEIILLHAYQIMPDIEISSEEIDDLPPHIRELFSKNSSLYVLVIDPLDGTDCYFEGGIEYAHMLGILDQENGVMLCSMVYFPELSKLYVAIRGSGAFVEDSIFSSPKKFGPKKPPRSFGEVKRLRGSDYQSFQRVGFTLDTTNNKSAAYAQIRVAEGKLGVMVMRYFHGYDTAIPSLIIEELGGSVLGDDGRKVQYEKTMPRMPLVISSLSPEFSEVLYEAQKEV